MSMLQGYELKASKPNVDGLCIFRLVDSSNCEIAKIDRPCILEEALTAARLFVEKELERKEYENG